MTSTNGFHLQSGAIKICGLRTPTHAGAAALAGADLIGFVFAPARRQVTAEQAAACIRAATLAAGCRRLFSVGVFVNESADMINAVAAAAGLDLVQLQGEEETGLLDHLKYPVAKAIRLPPGGTVAEAEALIRRYQSARNAPVAYLIDGYDPHHYGGQGVRADWDLARDLATQFPIVLAGGLDGTNVGEAIRQVRPRAVDVSSGVEVDGVKDIAKITAFVDAARRGFIETTSVG